MNRCRECGDPILEGVCCDACDPHWYGDQGDPMPSSHRLMDDDEDDDTEIFLGGMEVWDDPDAEAA